MTNEILTEIACPNCLNPIDVREHGQHVVCDACNSQFLLNGHLCIRCNSYSRDEAALCGQCGAPLKRICSVCRTINWIGDEYCVQCGEALDIADIIRRQSHLATRDRLNRQMSEAQRLKELEELASGRRMKELLAIEEARLAALHRRQAEIRARERRLLLAVFGTLALFVVMVIAYALLAGLVG